MPITKKQRDGVDELVVATLKVRGPMKFAELNERVEDVLFEPFKKAGGGVVWNSRYVGQACQRLRRRGAIATERGRWKATSRTS